MPCLYNTQQDVMARDEREWGGVEDGEGLSPTDG